MSVSRYKPESLEDAAAYLSSCLALAMKRAGLKRPNTRGRKSELAGDLYVRGAAEVIGITVTHMSRIICGRVRPGMEIAVRIKDFAGCSIEDVLAVSTARLVEEQQIRTNKAA